MRPTPFLALALSLLALSACSKAAPSALLQPTLADRLRNPLVAERFGSELTERMTELTIDNDPLLKDATKKSLVQKYRKKGLDMSANAAAAQKLGTIGEFIEASEFVRGRALILADRLYFSAAFETVAGPDLRVVLSTVVDPTAEGFPDATAIDIGPLDSPYGSQEYILPEIGDPLLIRTVAIWDKTLGRLYGFAQMNREYAK